MKRRLSHPAQVVIFMTAVVLSFVTALYWPVGGSWILMAVAGFGSFTLWKTRE